MLSTYRPLLLSGYTLCLHLTYKETEVESGWSLAQRLHSCESWARFHMRWALNHYAPCLLCRVTACQDSEYALYPAFSLLAFEPFLRTSAGSLLSVEFYTLFLKHNLYFFILFKWFTHWGFCNASFGVNDSTECLLLLRSNRLACREDAIPQFHLLIPRNASSSATSSRAPLLSGNPLRPVFTG